VTHGYESPGLGFVGKEWVYKVTSGRIVVSLAPEVARVEDGALKPPSPLPFASRRFYAIRSEPAPHALASRIKQSFPDIVAASLTESNCLLPKGFIAKVNDRGAVSLTGTNPHTPASSYAPYFDALTRRLNQSYPTGSNPWLAFTVAPTSVQLAIHSVPTSVLPDEDDQLYPFLKQSIYNAKEVPISAARYLNKNRDSRLSRNATSVVVSVDPKHVSTLQPALFLFSSRLKVEKTVQANRYTQCTNCYRYGHAAQRCPQKHPSCPYCALHHTRAAHRCQNPTCPKGGYSKPVSGCCPTSPPRCPNCGDDHDAFSRECRARPIPPPRAEAPPLSDDESTTPSDGEEAMDVADDGRPAPSTPETSAAQAVDLTTPRPSRRPVGDTSNADRLLPSGPPANPLTPSNTRARPGDV